jgi:uncharacterized protein (DUF488 family)
MEVFTIGFTKKNAKKFFELLRASGAKRVVDVRLNNISQLAGFAKRDDLQYFLEKVLGIGYVHMTQLAPTQDILDEYKKNGGNWDAYAEKFLELMHKRRVEESVPPELLADGCLLCSEDKPHNCHRRLVAEYLRGKWGGSLSIKHLG